MAPRQDRGRGITTPTRRPVETDAITEGVPVVVIEDADREAIAEALADVLLAALAREGDR
jgi:hypothetical protein